ncbi:MAG: S8 family peptidase [Eubacteriales bacterium]
MDKLSINSEKNQELLRRLLHDPETVDFIVQKNSFTESILQNHEVAIAYILNGRYAIAYATQQVYNEVRHSLGTGSASFNSIVLGLLGKASLQGSGIVQVQEQPFLNLKGQNVLVGFVDTGIDYTLDVFKYEDGTSKIAYIYDQSETGPPPEDYYIGVEYTNEQINEALQSDNPASVVPHTDESGHGTFLASVAAGREVGDFLGAAPDAEIIMVKLRKARPYYLNLFSVPPEQEFAYESSAIMLGVDYILSRARMLKKPVAICLGLGSNFGSHDAYTLFEEYLSDISGLPGVCLCIAAGNESQAKHHTEGTISAQGETQNIDIKVGENAGDFLVGVWTNVSDRVSVAVRSPTGEFVPRVPPIAGRTSETKLKLEDAAVQIAYFFPFEGTGSQLSAVRIINATQGIWTITVFGDLILDGTYHSWLPLTGFVSPNVEFLSTNPNFTVTVPATMNGAIVCGAYNYRTNSLYSATSWGPSRTGELAPDLVAPGVNISGYFPYGLGAMDGTSVAAAITAGASALLLQWGLVRGNDPTISSYQIRAYLIRGCNRSENMVYPNNRWGYGSLNLLNSFQLMRET